MTSLHYIIAGAGITGQSYLRWLQHQNWTHIHLVDQHPQKARDACAWFIEKEVGPAQSFTIVQDITDCPTTESTTLLLSPGWNLNKDPLSHFHQDLLEKGGTSLTDFDLFFQALQQQQLTPHIIGITGTNGKTTTTDLLFHTCTQAGINAKVGGNIGVPVLDLLQENLAAVPLFIFEFSSFQLAQMRDVSITHGVFLNLSADHLDYHKDLDDYAAAKARMTIAPHVYLASEVISQYPKLLLNKKATQVSVGEDQDASIRFESDATTTTYVTRHGTLTLSQETRQNMKHTANGAFVTAIAQDLGLSLVQIKKGLDSYQGQPHRQQIIAEKNGITFVNDSKATNFHAACEALKNFTTIYWLVGGVFKEKEIKLPPALCQKIRYISCFGKDGQKIESMLKKQCTQVPTSYTPSLTEALQKAYAQLQKDLLKKAAPGRSMKKATVLLSPLCASFDQFENYAHRGDVFIQLVHDLPQYQGARQ